MKNEVLRQAQKAHFNKPKACFPTNSLSIHVFSLFLQSIIEKRINRNEIIYLSILYNFMYNVLHGFMQNE